MIRDMTCRLAAAALVLGLAAVARARDEPPSVVLTATAEPAAAAPGDRITLKLTAAIREDHHIYGLEPGSEVVYATRVVFADAAWKADGATRGPDPEIHEDDSLDGLEVPWHVGSAVFEQDVTVPKDAKPGAATLEVGLHFMACTDSYCLDPETAWVEVTIRVEEPPPVTIVAEVRPATANPGETVKVLLTAEIAEGYHIYGLPPVPMMTYATGVKVIGPEGYEASGETVGPEAEFHQDDSQEGAEVPWYTGTVVFEQDVTVPADAKPGEVEIEVGLDHMACTETFCLDSEVVATKAVLVIAAGAGAAADPGADATSPETPTPAEKGMLGFLIGVFWAGVISIFLPCIYPLIPLTVAFFSKHEGSRAEAVTRAVLFCIGIIITFTVMGVVLGGALQAIATSLWLNVFLFLLMMVLALSLLGMFDLTLPSSWTEKMQAAGSGASFAAPIFMGFAFSLASFTCTIGIIGPILAAASTGEMLRPAAGMLAYSFGFSLPFFGLALFPAAVSSMPRSGGWMNAIKVILGFFEICFAGYYLWRMDLSLGLGIGSWPIILSIWVVCTFLAGLYMLGKIRLPHDMPVEKISVPALMIAVVLMSLSLYLFGGLMNQIRLPGWIEGLLPPRMEAAAVGPVTGGGGAVASAATPTVPAATPRPDFADETFHPGYGGVWWTTEYERALEIGRKSGRRVFLSFTGIFCSNCRTMEKGVFPLPAVREKLGEMVLVELWTDIPSDAAGERFGAHTTKAKSERYRELRRKPKPEGFATTANPHYVILSPEGERLAEMGYETDVETFVRFLATGADTAR